MLLAGVGEEPADDADVALLNRILWGAGSEGLLAVSRDEAERLHPLVDFDGIRCIMYEPDGGNVDPSGVTNAYADTVDLYIERLDPDRRIGSGLE